MTETMNKARERAESAFGRTQSQFIERSRVLSEHDAVTEARDEKTLRLRQLRKAKEASDLAAAVTPIKRARKAR